MQRRTPGKNRLRDAKGDGLFDAILTALLRLSLCTRMRQLCGLLTILPWPETKSKPKAKAKPNMTKYNLREDGSLRI